MLDRGIRHVPVLSTDGRGRRRARGLGPRRRRDARSFHLRAAIARATTLDELAAAAAGLTPTVIALHDARVAATDISAIHSVVTDALTRRLLELAIADLGAPPAPFAWIALGSLARREAVPSSDVDSALVWYADDDDPALRPALLAIAQHVMDGLEACGFRADPKGAVAVRGRSSPAPPRAGRTPRTAGCRTPPRRRR